MKEILSLLLICARSVAENLSYYSQQELDYLTDDVKELVMHRAMTLGLFSLQNYHVFLPSTSAELDFQFCTRGVWDEYVLRNASKRAPNIERLNLSRAHIPQSVIPLISQLFPSLRRLEVRDLATEWTKESLQSLSNAGSLTYLDISSSSPSVTAQALVEILDSVPLTTLIASCPVVVTPALMTACSRLETLTLPFLCDQQFLWPSMRTLKVNCRSDSSSVNLCSVQRGCPNLVNLTVIRSDLTTGGGTLHSFGKLSSVYFQSCNNLQKLLVEFLSQCPALKSVNLNRGNIPHHVLTAAFRSAPSRGQLNSVKLGYNNISSHDFADLLSCFPAAEELSFVGTKLGDRVCEMLCVNCPALKRVWFSITYSAFTSMVKGQCKATISPSIGEGIVSLATGCSNLQTVYLWNGEMIEDDLIARAKRVRPGLSVVIANSSGRPQT